MNIPKNARFLGYPLLLLLGLLVGISLNWDLSTVIKEDFIRYAVITLFVVFIILENVLIWIVFYESIKRDVLADHANELLEMNNVAMDTNNKAIKIFDDNLKTALEAEQEMQELLSKYKLSKCE